MAHSNGSGDVCMCVCLCVFVYINDCQKEVWYLVLSLRGESH